MNAESEMQTSDGLGGEAICKRCKEMVRPGSYYVEAEDGEIVCGRHLSPAEIEAARKVGTLGETCALPQTEAERRWMLNAWGMEEIR